MVLDPRARDLWGVAVAGVVVGSGVAVAWFAGRFRAAVILVLICGFGAVSGVVATRRAHERFTGEVPSGLVEVSLYITRDPTQRNHGFAIARPGAIDGERWRGPKLAVGPVPNQVSAGDDLIVTGTLSAQPRRVGQDLVAGTLRVVEVLDVRASRSPLFIVGNALRSRVREAFPSGSSSDSLARGLLIGDVDDLRAKDLEDLRRSGLAHFVAVSGSNVALFLGAWWLIGLPLSIHPRTRALFGFAGLAIFVVVTRWEPSVVRASVMAAVPLAGGLIGIPVDPWMALGVAVTAIVLAAGDVVSSVGFLLSVFATAGVMIGVAAVSGRRPAWMWMPLGATLGAQIAVAPILLVVFGSIPLVAPLANLVAAPVVALTTVLGLVGVVIPLPVVVGAVRVGASAVLLIAERAAGGPQLGLLAYVGLASIATLVVVRRLRAIGIAALIGVLLFVSVAARPHWPTVPTAVVLDVGQGDAILLLDPSGSAALVDGGREPAVLDRALRRHGVRELAVVVVTHGDADHVGGLVELLDTTPVGEVWVGAFANPSVLVDEVVEDAARHGVPVRAVERNDRAALGDVSLVVVNPQRRYASDNDGSVVVLASARRSILLPGDIEAIGQRELPDVHPDAMVVPHHGSGTTDRAWLTSTVGAVAVISYGPNTYGHPHPEIVELLERMGTEVWTTAEDGDVAIPLG